ncbi:hypothetical protein BKA70DRAFT_1579018 [Coprinopsis sp. MPI-PUGE-AT-0042]|nr:hypothetical protein BKA70DRAFT_1579018 [Coprinopsis sp. MPI-PUGE-AT-0042]
MTDSIFSGNVYQILTKFHDGGSVSVPELRRDPWLNLVNDTNADTEKWIFHAADVPGTFRIESYSHRSYFATEDPPTSYVYQARTDAPTAWFLQQSPTIDPDYNFRICPNYTCSSYWVPRQWDIFDSLVDPHRQIESRQVENPFANAIVLRTRPYTGSGFESWRIKPAGVEADSTSSTGSSSSSSSETLLSSLPSPSITATKSGDPEPPRTSTTGDHEQLNALKECAPCGSTECSFTPSGEPQKDTYSVLIGQPVSNCAEGSEETTRTKLGGTFQLQTSWSVEVSVSAGFGFMGPSISSTVTGTTGGSESITQTQEIEVSIRPGQIGALVANISYTKQPGQVNIDDSTLAFVSVQPEFVLGYSVLYTNCSANFRALTLPKAQCEKSSARPARNVPFSPAKVMVFWAFLFAMGTVLA